MSKGWQKGKKATAPRNVRRVLVICEDSKSSRDYFSSFPVDSNQVEIICEGTGKNTDSLMETALERRRVAFSTKTPYEAIWVVFDKDSFSQQQFNRSFDLAKPFSDMLPCWSNECFELWYLLHFCYRDTGVGRDEIYERLSKCHLGREYNKSDISVFDQLKPRLQQAINNAKRLAYENTIQREPQRNPSTRVHELVEVLLSFDPAKQ